MYDFFFKYTDGNEIRCQNITKVEYDTSNGYAQVIGEQILTHHFRIYGNLYLYSDTSNSTIDCKGLLYIKVSKK